MNPHLALWQRIVDAPVIGQVGHRRTQEAGGCHPQGRAPAWCTSKGISLTLLHRAHAALLCHDRPVEADEDTCGVVRVTRAKRVRQAGNVVKMKERRTA
jgi:hypothetical protein